MALIVQKFGGSSVADAVRVRNVAKIITDTYKAGNAVIAVVSAQGDTTDDLIDKAAELNPNPSKREMDVLLSAGEQMSASLMAMAIEQIGCPVVSLLGWQAGFQTSSGYGLARIRTIDTERMTRELDQKRIIIVAGFQGLCKYGDITTFGRGGSDTTAVAIAAVMHADKCQIFTDVDGVYTADPRKIKNAQKLSEITYDEMLELATLGAQVLNNRSVEMAKKYNVELEVLTSFQYGASPIDKMLLSEEQLAALTNTTTGRAGTIVKETVKMEKMLVRGVTKDNDAARISIVGVKDVPGVAFRVFSKLAAKNINVDIILQSVGHAGVQDISFTVSEANAAPVRALLENDFETVLVDTGVSKISVVGAGMETHPGTAAKMFEALYSEDINIQMIATSEIKISVLIDQADADKAVAAVHAAFFGKE
ncbi:MAG: aspartate kinase [Oscillospiraceae bacterium]|jgi:aspartate kinase|nr:aspartate kinase [Oscillospiraceae bacterium]